MHPLWAIGTGVVGPVNAVREAQGPPPCASSSYAGVSMTERGLTHFRRVHVWRRSLLRGHEAPGLVEALVCWTVERALTNLEAKVADRAFTTDLDPLLVSRPPGHSIEIGLEVARVDLDAANAP